jgi:hypothetical protein
MSISFSSAVESLIFNWESPAARNLAIAGFLLLSFVGHAACFYIFQIVYPPTIALLPPPARLSLITPDSEEGRTLLRWVESEDPALASRTERPPEAKTYLLPKLEHVPSYVASEPVLKELPPLLVDLSMPSSQPPGAVPVTRRRTAQKPAVIPTTVTFSKEIENLGPPALPPLKFNASTSEAPQAINFRIAVSSHGEILYFLPLNSSADPALDEQARHYLALCRFPSRLAPSNQALVWGTAIVEWGNDVARPQPTPTSVTSQAPTNTPAP